MNTLEARYPKVSIKLDRICDTNKDKKFKV